MVFAQVEQRLVKGVKYVVFAQAKQRFEKFLKYVSFEGVALFTH